MKKQITFFILFFAISITSINAKSVDSTLAKVIAKNLFYERVNSKQSVKYSDIDISLAYTRQEGSTNIYYVFNITGKSKGFVIISADDAAYPVLGYSLEGNYVQRNQPPAFIDWMNNYKNQIIYIKQNELKSTAQIDSIWKKYQDVPKINSCKNVLSAGPLLTTTWDQPSPYNNLCPGGSLTGCVATAMGQIMRYWGTDEGYYFPSQGIGSHTDANNSSCTVNYCSQNYDWADMSNSINGSSSTTQINAVATLLYDCGVSVDMTYGTSESSAYMSNVPNALINYFGYASTAQWVQQSSYSSTDWDNILTTELDAGRPVQYSGTDYSYSPPAGHSFVCDGYGYDGTNYYYDFNWGWSGTYDGYYYLTSLNPSSYNFTSQAAVIGIQPGGYISMYDNFSLTPNPIVQGQSLSVTVELANFGFENFSGSVYLGLYNTSTGALVEPLDSGTTTQATQTYSTYTFNTSNITAAPGNYLLAVLYLNNSYCWIIAPETSNLYTNPLTVQVITSTGIKENSINDAISVYPSPAKDNITIESTLQGVIEITNIQGQLIETLATTGNKTNIDVSAFAKGMYFVKVRTEKGVAVKKFIKQ